MTKLKLIRVLIENGWWPLDASEDMIEFTKDGVIVSMTDDADEWINIYENAEDEVPAEFTADYVLDAVLNKKPLI